MYMLVLSQVECCVHDFMCPESMDARVCEYNSKLGDSIVCGSLVPRVN